MNTATMQNGQGLVLRVVRGRSAAICATTAAGFAATGFAAGGGGAGAGVPAPGRRPWRVVFDFDHFSRHVYLGKANRAHRVPGRAERPVTGPVVSAGAVKRGLSGESGCRRGVHVATPLGRHVHWS